MDAGIICASYLAIRNQNNNTQVLEVYAAEHFIRHVKSRRGAVPQRLLACSYGLFRVVRGVVVHQAAVEQDLLLVRREALDVKGDVLHATALTDDLRGDGLGAGLDRLADAGHEHHVAVLIIELGAFREGEGQDAPVDAVAAVTLGGVLIAEVGVAAEHLLA